MKTPAPPTPAAAPREDEDARELEPFVRSQDAVELQAALWATRRHEGLDPTQEAAFERWLAEDPRHGEAYEELERSLDHVRDLPDADVQSLKAGLDLHESMAGTAVGPPTDRLHPAGPSPRLASPGRRAWMLDLTRLFPTVRTAAGVAALVGGGWLGWDQGSRQPTYARTFASERGQILGIDLPDGSALQLDTATQIQVSMYRQRREVRLIEGQVMFSVQGDAAAPFDVLAGSTRVTVIGTRFSVRHTRAGLDAGKTVVAVEEGRVRVGGVHRAASPEASGDGAVLTAGQGVTVRGDGRLGAIVSLPADGVGAWRAQRVSFSDTPLAEALAEFERYRHTGLVIRDPSVGALRVGGSFDLRQVGLFAQALPHMLPVRLAPQGAVTVIAAAK
ncbi:FecR domain-containing protein [Hydrogenophaga sp. UC242_53]|uniref:FecR family protein n=1 Tax=Hydrogenophaga sp. UC242_53 TaxID=3350170 RepID=UPI0036D2446F